MTEPLSIDTRGRGCYDITAQVQEWLRHSPVTDGLCHLFLQHTSASLIITENADPAVLQDLEHYLARLVIDGDHHYQHNSEGPDDMAAHLRSILTQTELSVPLRNGQLQLGTWQGIFLYEHRYQAQRRRLMITCLAGP